MKRLVAVFLPALAVAGLAGSAEGVIQLRHAMRRSQALYTLGTVGSQIEGDLEFEIQESRRAVLHALAVDDPSQQLPYLDTAKAAARNVTQGVQSLARLNLPQGAASNLQRFGNSWSVYGRSRDELIARILGNDRKGAMEVEQRGGDGGFSESIFSESINDLHAFKRSLEDYARAQAASLDATLRACILAVTCFGAAVALIVLALLQSNRRRAAAAQSLRAVNHELAKSREMDLHRVAILEKIGTHSPLTETLADVAQLAGVFQPGAGAAIWIALGDALLYQVSSGLPHSAVDELRSRSFNLGTVERIGLEVPGLACTRVLLRNAAQDVIGLILLFRDPAAPVLPACVAAQMAQLGSLAVENSTLYDRLAFQAQHDVLTGLPNRLLFQDHVQQSILLAQRNRRKAAVLWIDVDRFKQINDTLGHRAGDELLAEVSRRLRLTIRESDTAARIGGDEFVVLAADIESASDSELLAERIMNSLRAPIVAAGRELRISVSIGMGLFPDHGSDPAALMRNADLAMYQAKRAGRDAAQTFLPQFGASAGRRLQVEQGLRQALEGGGFYLEYQPLIDRFDDLHGFEALLRWSSPKLGNVSPAEFIPIAEEAGMIGRIGEWVMRMACRDGARWMQAGIDVPRISVNASGLQFADPGFAGMVRAALEEFGFPAGRLEIEVTETALVNDIERALEQIVRLKGLGIKFAIDDFGTGYSSLNQLRTLPVDYVKVDRSFIKDLHQAQSDSSTLVRGIIGLAHNLQLHVVAEGVETQAQLSLLRSMGCDVSQGFFLHRPMSVDAAEKLMKQYAAEPVGVS